MNNNIIIVIFALLRSLSFSSVRANEGQSLLTPMGMPHITQDRNGSSD
ncbi:MAG: hypothetical protein K0S08_1566 [Gammaproteobacteria bacterium]|jgi:hypothetical protein|nr:hypothetical protein [Gammaproteobacteria bacterium]